MWSAIACQAAPASPAITAAAIAAWSSSISCAQLERIDAQEHVGADDVSDGPDDEGEHAVVGEIGDTEVQAVRVRHVGRARSPVVEVRAVHVELADDREALGIPRRQLGRQRLEHPPRPQQLLVRGAGELEVQRHRAAEVHRLGAADDRPAVRPAPDADDPLRLEQPERFAKRLRGSPRSARPSRPPAAGESPDSRPMIDDVADDRERDDLRRLPHRPLADGGNGERFGCVLHVSGRKRWLPHSAPLRVAQTLDHHEVMLTPFLMRNTLRRTSCLEVPVTRTCRVAGGRGEFRMAVGADR